MLQLFFNLFGLGMMIAMIITAIEGVITMIEEPYKDFFEYAYLSLFVVLFSTSLAGAIIFIIRLVKMIP